MVAAVWAGKRTSKCTGWYLWVYALVQAGTGTGEKRGGGCNLGRGGGGGGMGCQRGRPPGTLSAVHPCAVCEGLMRDECVGQTAAEW